MPIAFAKAMAEEECVLNKCDVLLKETSATFDEKLIAKSGILYVPLRWGFIFKVNTSNFQSFTLFHTEPHQ